MTVTRNDEFCRIKNTTPEGQIVELCRFPTAEAPDVCMQLLYLILGTDQGVAAVRKSAYYEEVMRVLNAPPA